ncbi:MAG: glycosyltransferase family 4 protein [Patescibacteria group bacterium]|jgi:glycosyltransferase involved in cell wall biosynthesis
MNKAIKRIGIDCRFWGVKHAGLGRYTRDLVLAIIPQLSSNLELTLFFQKGQWQEDKKALKTCNLIEVNVPHYSLKEQLFFWKVVEDQRLDLAHYPHFNVPVFAKTPFVVTIHDLIKHFFKGMPVTTRNALVYWVKYGGYHFTINSAVKKARKIITPSLFTKDQVASHYPETQNKIEVVYEGVDHTYISKPKKPGSSVLKIMGLSRPFFIYTGSAYPSKNLPVLLEALKTLTDNGKSVSLVIACARDAFWKKLEKDVKAKALEEYVKLPGRLSDTELRSLYLEASALIVPSLMEGFGLPGLEAMSVGCPVIASNAGSLPEVYGSAATYFHPQDFAELSKQMEKMILLDPNDREKLGLQGKLQAQKYSWDKAAKETLSVYQSCLDGNS